MFTYNCEIFSFFFWGKTLHSYLGEIGGISSLDSKRRLRMMLKAKYHNSILHKFQPKKYPQPRVLQGFFFLKDIFLFGITLYLLKEINCSILFFFFFLNSGRSLFSLSIEIGNGKFSICINSTLRKSY